MGVFFKKKIPILSNSPATAQIGNGKHASHVPAEDEARHVERRGDGNVKAAIAVQQRRVVAVQHNVCMCVLVICE